MADSPNRGLTPGLEEACTTCGELVGDHTVRGLGKCLEGLNYHMPYEEVPDGPLAFEGIEGDLAGELTIAAAVLEAPALGLLPALQFRFFASGRKPMQHIPLRPVTLVMDDASLRQIGELVVTSVEAAIKAAGRQ